ncbi:hypothetical protein DL93DRAFT_2087303 [Clavulina sp. PMI_390]|nr:hypothetical protein DL93DRAFT_2087303 [Clavulina sp. PMI_390]
MHHILTFAAFFASWAVAVDSAANSRSTVPRSLRQFNPHRASPAQRNSPTTAACGTCISATFNPSRDLAPLLNIPSSKLQTITTQWCFCENNIPAFVDSNVAVQAAVALTSKSDVIAAITQLFNENKGNHACSSPSNGVASCSANYATCSFQCSNGFTASSDKCVCNGYVCNGQCQSAECPTTSARAFANRKRQLASCPEGYTMCGIPGLVLDDDLAIDAGLRTTNTLDTLDASRGYECIDARTNVESCGGCSNPLSISPQSRIGQDCTQIPHASSVSCRSGGCVVEACAKGWKPAPGRSTCVRS